MPKRIVNREVANRAQKRYRDSEYGKAKKLEDQRKRRAKGYTEEQIQHKRNVRNTWCQKNREHSREVSNRYTENNPDKNRKYALKTKYDMTVKQFEEMLSYQNGVCALCGLPTQDGQTLVVDHDHKCCPGKKSCGKCIRGILHSNCNVVLGMLNESSFLAVKAYEYIKLHKKKRGIK
jgi:hypothetical protein